MNQILLVSSDLRCYRKYGKALASAGFTLSMADNSPGTWKALLASRFDLLVVDVTRQTTEMDPWRLCVELAKATALSLVIIMPSGRNQDLLRAHRLGATQCLTTPVSLKDLKACFTAACATQVLPSPSTAQPTVANYEDPVLRIDFDNRLINRGALTFGLTRSEFAVLHKLVSEAGRAVPLKILRAEVWSQKETPSALHSLKNCILRLRRKVEPDASHPRYIISHFGFGYRFAQVPCANSEPKDDLPDPVHVPS